MQLVKYFPQSGQSPRFGNTDPASVIGHVALEIAAFQDGEWYASGSSVIIGPHLALTARHVVEDICERFHGRGYLDQVGENQKLELSFGGRARHRVDDVDILWSIDKVWFYRNLDIAVYSLLPCSESARNFDWWLPVMNLQAPKIGSTVSAFGYRQSKASVRTDEPIAFVEWDSIPTSATGNVAEIHRLRRDSVMLPFPCFRINAQFDGSMSGGPVVNNP